MTTWNEDARELAAWVAAALTASGYQADFTLASLGEIDRFLDEHAPAGEAVPEGLLGEDLDHRLFALGAYVGEALVRHYGGRWETDEADPEAEGNLRVVLTGGAVLWPVQRVIKRFLNGPEESLHAYGQRAAGAIGTG
jgi:hypothetical protein